MTDEITSPLGAQIFEFCESEFFPEALQNSEVGSSSNCCYEEHTSYPTTLSNIYKGAVENPARNSKLQGMVLEDDISASIDFTLSHDQQYTTNQEAFPNPMEQNQLLGEVAAEGSLYAPHLYNPEEYNIRLRSADPMIASYLSSTAPFPLDSPWLVLGGVDQEMESQGDNGGFLFPDSLARALNCSTADLQTLSTSESQHMVNGSPSTTLASEISSLEDPTFKVGKISAEERKRKIHRYLKKRNERNFSKKIKYACRKTLADSRPRVRGRFAKNDELGELARNSGNNQDDDVDEDVNQMLRNSMPDHHHKAVKEEDGIDPSELFSHISEVNSFKCNYPIQSWI
ncbi:zinc finger protein CONSTANS-LIKE 10-like isoform X2 [Salvia miltiorrhiza]|uniref:zinc finger protein CONSTANS-LIKE 10-like isoform X2 n=1 Tax=Salvia miltiorrhiza TaxID=226208 RepID=UPI0025AB80FF|nr:zinc finger protein CONSTANS-LIKE 10-like isoform X2 [Salvia miltiorrhiza]